MRDLNAVEKDGVFDFRGITHYAVIADKGVATDKRAVTNFRVFADNTVFPDIRRLGNFNAFMRPDLREDLIVIFGRSFAKLEDKRADTR